MKITPRSGDYVRTDGITDEQYHAVAKAFLLAGFGRGEYGSEIRYAAFNYFGISRNGSCLFHDNSLQLLTGRELSLSDLLGDEEVVWDGVGVPPVGLDCEYITPAGQWEACKILFVGERLGVISRNGTESSFDKSYLKFRPLKSERETAIQEMYKIVGVDVVSPYDLDFVFNKLYDAGYRKIKDVDK